MKPAHILDFALALALTLFVLGYLWYQPLSMESEITYTSSADGGGAVALSGGDRVSPWQTKHRGDFSLYTTDKRRKTVARVTGLQEVPLRVRMELTLPRHAEFVVHHINVRIVHPLMSGTYALEADDVVATQGARLVPINQGVAVERNAQRARIEASLSGLQGQIRWMPASMALSLLGLGGFYGLLRTLRRLPWDKHASLGIYCAFFVVFITQALHYIEFIPFGKAPDERAHLSYVAHLQETGRWYPDFERMPIYFNTGAETEEVNYLGHAPAYYLLMSAFSPDRATGVMTQWRNLRFANLALACISLAILFWIGLRQQVPISFHFMYALVLTSIPMLPYLAASVNNDNLAIFSGAVLLAGGMLVLEENPTAHWLLGLGIGLAPLAKATAGLQALLFVFLLLWLLWRNGNSVRELWGRFALPVGLGATLPLLYYGYTQARYGTPLPSFGTIAYERQADMEPLDFMAYLSHFKDFLRFSWAGIVSHQGDLPSATGPWYGALALVPLFAFWGLFVSTRGFDPRIQRLFAVAKLGMLALLGFAVIHFAKVYSRHLHDAYLGGIQARYYFPFAACIALTALLPLYRWRTQAWTRIVGLLAAGHLLYANLLLNIATKL